MNLINKMYKALFLSIQANKIKDVVQVLISAIFFENIN